MPQFKQNHFFTTPSLTTVSVTVLLFYIAFTVVALGLHDWDPLWFAWLGPRFRDLDPTAALGYDGQFSYYLATDGWDAVAHLDNPAYRLQRIFYPVVVWAVSFGRDSLVAWNLLVVNIASITVTTYLLARWLRQQNTSPWYALVYAFYTGTFMAYSRDVTELLGFLLATAGLLLWFSRRYWPALLLFALAALTKEITLLIPIGIGITELVRRQWVPAMLLFLAPVPLVVWQWMIEQRIGVFPIHRGTPSLQPIPLYGILSQLNREPGRLTGLAIVAIPSVVLALFALYRVIGDRQSYLAWILLIQAVFVMLLPTDVYDHMMHVGRNASGMIIATILLLPILPTKWRLLTAVTWVGPTLIWLVPIIRWEHY